MPDSKISALPSATVPLAGTEVLPVVQGGTTDKVTAADLLRQNGQTVTTSNPVLSLAQTWNAGGVTFTGVLFNATDTASATASYLLDLQVGGASSMRVTKAAVLTLNGGSASAGGVINAGANTFRTIQFGSATYGSNGIFAVRDSEGVATRGSFYYGWESGANNPATGTIDLALYRDAANTLALRNSTNAQTFRVYNTFTDASNYERGSFAWNTNNFDITVGQAGTGSARSMRIYTTGAASLQLGANNSLQWFINTSGHFLAAVDNTYDIGASGANRPRSIYVGSQITVGSAINWTSKTKINGNSVDGNLVLQNNGGASFGLLQLGGETNLFPAWKRSSAAMHARLADDSAYADIACASLDTTGRAHILLSTAIPAGGTAGVGYRFSSTANFGVFFGSGAPTLSAAKGSLYLRSDGSGTGDRMYVNTDGSTTWTAVTTAA